MISEATLSQPQVRCDLLAYLSEISAADPRPIWLAARKCGIASGIDEVFHFFFDDNDFDESAVGVALCSQAEVQLISEVKRALEAVLDAVGDVGDEAYVSHPIWPSVRHAARIAETGMVGGMDGN